MLNPFDRNALRSLFAKAKPYPHVVIENFIDADKAREIVAAYPPFDLALQQGTSFATVNERKKVQISDSAKFSAPVQELNSLLASPEFLADLSFITGIPNLLADDQLVGGGIHMTGHGGRLDVHVDFNLIEDRQLHRRLNLLLYLNEGWRSKWGGQFQLWDKDVKHCESAFDPLFNRCIIFETNEISYHGVLPVSPDAPAARRSFAAYYYTKEAPTHWTGESHSTIFKARPDEKLKGSVLMPAETMRRNIMSGINRAKSEVKKLLGR
jgi:Rps23 Pro-64 3,4-dihydroxylase Tpa1-like proline 4-hydroxylase